MFELHPVIVIRKFHTCTPCDGCCPIQSGSFAPEPGFIAGRSPTQNQPLCAKACPASSHPIIEIRGCDVGVAIVLVQENMHTEEPQPGTGKFSPGRSWLIELALHVRKSGFKSLVAESLNSGEHGEQTVK